MNEPKEVREARKWLKKSEFNLATVVLEAKSKVRSLLAQYDRQSRRTQPHNSREEINEDMQ